MAEVQLRFLAHSPNWPPAGLTGTYEVNHEIPYWNGRIFQVRRDTVVNPRNGTEHDMFVLHQPNWVNIIPATKQRPEQGILSSGAE
jgi:hypothetical protein